MMPTVFCLIPISMRRPATLPRIPERSSQFGQTTNTNKSGAIDAQGVIGWNRPTKFVCASSMEQNNVSNI